MIVIIECTNDDSTMNVSSYAIYSFGRMAIVSSFAFVISSFLASVAY